jgi:peptidoglycan hydrolase-like protein with peptidoglycan-binding domain
MPLQSILFRGNARLEDCLVRDPAHVVLGDIGPHVVLLQDALRAIDGLNIDPKRYGPSTAAAVLAYKKKRQIINRTYQSTEDNIVGKMTLKSLDDELVILQGRTQPSSLVSTRCPDNRPPDLIASSAIVSPPRGITNSTV